MNCILCHACYYLGDCWSKLINFIPDSWERIGLLMVKPYHVFMQWSVNLDVRGKCGIWRYADNGKGDGQ